MTTKELVSKLRPFEDYWHIIDKIKYHGGLFFIKVIHKVSQKNMFDEKIMTIGCADAKIEIDISKMSDLYVDIYIRGIFAELETECAEKNKWYYQRIRGPKKKKEIVKFEKIIMR